MNKKRSYIKPEIVLVELQENMLSAIVSNDDEGIYSDNY